MTARKAATTKENDMTFIDETTGTGTSGSGGGADRADEMEARALGIEMHAAATSGDTGRIKALIEQGANPDARAPDGSTPLHTAARHGQSGAVAELLLADVAPNARNDDGTTPLHLAASAGHPGSINLLVAYGADTEARDARERTAVDRLPENSPDGIREMFVPTEDLSLSAEAELRDQDHPAPETPHGGAEGRTRETTADMPMHDERQHVEIRKGDQVRQPDGSWQSVERVDKDGAWVEGNLVTARVPADWARENVRTATQSTPDGSPCKPAGPERGAAPGTRQETPPAGDGRSSAGEVREITLAPDLEQEAVRRRERDDQLLQLACMATERIAPEQRENWGDLRQRIGALLETVDKAAAVPEAAVDARAQKTARKRAEADVWVKAAREAGGDMLHQASARFTGSAEFYRQDQMEHNAAAITKGLDGLTDDVLRPNTLERVVARAVVATAGTQDEEVARGLERGLRLGWVPAATTIRMEQEQIVGKLSKPMDDLGELERAELTDRIYRTFPEDELRAVSRGEGPAASAARDPEAKARLVGNFKALHAEPVDLPTPWRGLHVEIGVSAGVPREQLQPERSAEAAAERSVSASM